MTARVLSLIGAMRTRRGNTTPPDDPRVRRFEALVQEAATTHPVYFRLKLDSALGQAVSLIAHDISTDIGVQMLVSLAKHLNCLDQWIADVERTIGPRR